MYLQNALVGELMWVRMRKFFFLASFLFSLLVKRISFEWIEKLTSWQQEKCCCLLAVVRVPCFRCIILQNNIVSNVRFCNYICVALLLLPPEKILSSSLWFLIPELECLIWMCLLFWFPCLCLCCQGTSSTGTLLSSVKCANTETEREREISL